MDVKVKADVLAKKRTREEFIEYAERNSDKKVYLQYPKGHFDFPDGEVITYDEVSPGTVLIKSAFYNSYIEVTYDYENNATSPALNEFPTLFRGVANEAIQVFRGAVLMRLYDSELLAETSHPHKNKKPLGDAGEDEKDHGVKRRSWIPQKTSNAAKKDTHHRSPKYRVFVPGHFRFKGTPKQVFIRPHTRWNNLPVGDAYTEMFYA